MSESQDILKEELQDPEYRQAYAEDFSNASIATQIRVLREQRGWTQEDLAKKIGTKQAGLSRLENINYFAWETETLMKIARAFDVRLRITFETFRTLLDEAEKFSLANLERPGFDNDPVFHQAAAVSEYSQATIPTVNYDWFVGSFQKSTSVSAISNVDVDQFIILTGSGLSLRGSAAILNRDEIPSQPAKIINATNKGEIKYGGYGRAAA